LTVVFKAGDAAEFWTVSGGTGGCRRARTVAEEIISAGGFGDGRCPLEKPFSLCHGAFESFVEDLVASSAERDLDAVRIFHPWRNGTKGVEDWAWGFCMRPGLLRELSGQAL
jgi:hypothetical protein